jgi:hypothetical protein
VRLLVGFFLTFITAAAVGLGLTWAALDNGLSSGAVRIGAWTAWPKKGTTDIDPYARAIVSRSGELPVGLGDGTVFYARADEKGRPLDGHCDLTVSGTTPQARFWTLTLYDPQGQLVANTVDRHGFTSEEIVRTADGGFTIAVGPKARSGNWLPTGGIDRYVLLLRFYDTPIGMAMRTTHDIAMPSVAIKGCP